MKAIQREPWKQMNKNVLFFKEKELKIRPKCLSNSS